MLLLSKLECNGAMLAHLCLPGSSHSPASASQVAAIPGSCYHTQLIFFVFLVETGFLYIGQAGLELPTSDDLPALASQRAGTTGLSHLAQQKFHAFLPRNQVSSIPIVSLSVPIQTEEADRLPSDLHSTQ